MRHKKLYALIWKRGKYSVGNAETIAKAYCKTKKLILGLLRLNGGSKFVYSIKLSWQWRPQGTITDTGSHEGNRRAAFRDFFRNYLLNNQGNYSIIKLIDNSR